MANSRFTQFFYTKHMMPVSIDCNVAIGSTGAVSALKGSGVYAVTRLAVGTYKVQFQDAYYKLYGMRSAIKAPVTGSNVAATALVPGTVYEITAVGTTTQAQWVTAGVPYGTTAAVGVAFVAAATSSGNGTAKAIGVSGVSCVELVGVTNTELAPLGLPQLQGGYAIVQCLGATDASTTTLIPKDPASGSTLYLEFYMSNSSVLVQSE